VSSGQFDEARRILADDSALPDIYRRRLLTKILRETESWTDLKSLLERPQNDEELAMYTVAAERSGDLTGVEAVLGTAEGSGDFSLLLIAELKQRVATRMRLGR